MTEKKEDGGKKKKKTDWPGTIALLVVCLVVGGIVFFLTYSSKTVSPAPLENTVVYDALICVRNNQSSNEILTTTDPLSVKETAKVIYRNGEFEKISFTYEGEYKTEEQAIKAENELHSTYYRYIGSLNIGVSDYQNNYNILGKKTTMDLSSGKSDTPASILKLFSYDSSKKISEASEEELIGNYTSKGFNCEKTQ